MIDLPLFAAFCAAVAVLMLTPGPTVAVITANTVAHGTRYGLLTVAGGAAAVVPMLLVVAAGLSAIATVLAEWFEVLRWAGVGYLVALGILAWRAPLADLTAIAPQRRSVRRIFLGGFVVSATNPKTLLFLGAFFPQFIDPDRPFGPQITLLALSYFAIGAIIDTLWAILAGRLRFVIARSARLRNRITGALFVSAGIGLALVRRT